MKTHLQPTLKSLEEILSRCDQKRISLDTETTGVNWWSDRLTTLGFYCPDAGVEGCIDFCAGERPVLKDFKKDKKLKDPERAYQKALVEWERRLEHEMAMAAEVKAIVKRTLKPGTVVVMHNSKFDCSMLEVDMQQCGWRIVDTTILIHLYDSRMFKALGTAEKILLGSSSKREHVEKAPKKNSKRIWLWPEEVRIDYCLNDCRVTYQLSEALGPFISKLGLTKLFNKDTRYNALLYKVEHRGFTLDRKFVREAEGKLQQDLEELKQELTEKLFSRPNFKANYIQGLVNILEKKRKKKIKTDIAQEEREQLELAAAIKAEGSFNWASNEQLSAAVYDGYGWERPINPFLNSDGVDTSKFADRGKYNESMTSTFILAEKAKHPLAGLIASMRETAKLLQTVRRWLDLADEDDIIHTNYNVTGTRTGRLSSSKPNLQNVVSKVRNVFTGGETIRKQEYDLRNAFVARPGKILLSIDHKQQEMRMFGLLSQDPNMLALLEAGEDIHSGIAIKVWKKLSTTTRKWAKQVSLGLIYGASTGSLQFKLGMSRSEAQRVVDDYWNTFPRIRPWMFEVIENCKRYGYVKYWSGRLWREDSEQHMYKGANAAIQGGSADLLSIAALRADAWCEAQGEGWGGLINLIHDELTFEIPDEPAEILRAAAALSEIMEVADLFGLPFFTDCKLGYSYGGLQEMPEAGGAIQIPQGVRTLEQQRV